MSDPINEKQIGGILRKIYNWFVPVAGIDPAGNPQVIAVNTDGSLRMGSPGIAIPTYDYQSISYAGSTNNIASIVYKTGGSGGTTVATLTFTYFGGTPTANDALVATITKT